MTENPQRSKETRLMDEIHVLKSLSLGVENRIDSLQDDLTIVLGILSRVKEFGSKADEELAQKFLSKP